MDTTFFISHTSVPEFIKILLKRHLSKIAPGILNILNLYYLSRYRKDAVAFFVESPCRFYIILKEVYKGGSVDMVLKLFVESISNDSKIVEMLINYVKTCNDKAFNETVTSIIQNKYHIGKDTATKTH